MSRHSHHWHHQTTFAVHWTLAWDRSWAWLPGSYIKRSHPCCFCLVNIQILGAKDETLAAKANPSQFCWSWCLHVCGFFFLWAFGESDCDIYIYCISLIYWVISMNLQRGRNLPIHHVTKHKKRPRSLRSQGSSLPVSGCLWLLEQQKHSASCAAQVSEEVPCNAHKKNRYYVAYSRSYVSDTWCFCFQINLPQDLYKYGIFLNPTFS